MGAAIIVIFADERLNRPLNAAKDTYRRRERLVALLAPVQLSQRRLYRNGFAFYTGFMLTVYLVLSFGASIFGPFFIPNAEDTIGGPEWPLVVALVMTGLLPALKPLQRIENKIRDYAYVLAGVPNSFHDFTDALMHVHLDETRLGYDLVQNDEALKLHNIFDAAKAAFENNYEYKAFADHAGKLFAFRS